MVVEIRRIAVFNAVGGNQATHIIIRIRGRKMKTLKTTKKATKKPVKKKVAYEYWISFVDRNNKFGSLLCDMDYMINNKENAKKLSLEMNRVLNGNYRATINIMFLRKKFVKEEENGN